MNEATSNVSYKSLHEDFVSGWSGTSLFEVSVLTTIPAASILVRDLFCLVFDHVTDPWILFMVNFAIIVLPLLFGTTVLDFINVTVLISVYTIAGGTIAFIVLFWSNKQPKQSKEYSVLERLMKSDMGMRRPFITYTRAQALLGTAGAILSVDFPIFPRRLAKAETYGTGLMDAGVGMFVVMNAIVSPEARGKHVKNPLLQAVTSSVPLVVLGALRLLAVKNIDYQEHVSEYGVHWNFFITLAAVKILSALIFTLFPVGLCGLISLAVAFGYQFCLSRCGLTQYMLHSSDGQGGRHEFMDANREGIWSCFGYLATYLAGVELGRFIFKQRETVGDWVKAMVTLLVTSTLSWILLGAVSSSVEPVSRRLANGSYVLWMVALNSYLLTVYLLGDVLVTSISQLYHQDKKAQKNFEERLKSNCLMSAMNYNGLLYFLAANLLTGLVNMTTQTIYASTSKSLLIIALYTFILSALATVLYRKKISTKIW